MAEGGKPHEKKKNGESTWCAMEKCCGMIASGTNWRSSPGTTTETPPDTTTEATLDTTPEATTTTTTQLQPRPQPRLTRPLTHETINEQT